MTRTLTMGCVLAVVVGALAGCGGSGQPSAAEQKTQREASLFEIEQIEKTFHLAATTHNVNLMMSLFAPGAVFDFGTTAYTGKAQIRNFFADKNPAFQPQNHWEADTPSYLIRATVDGDKGTLYFQCHFIDVKTGKVMDVVSVDHQVQKIGGKWLIVDSEASPGKLSTQA